MTIEVNGKTLEITLKETVKTATKAFVGYSSYKMMAGAGDIISTLPVYGDLTKVGVRLSARLLGGALGYLLMDMVDAMADTLETAAERKVNVALETDKESENDG